MDSNFWYRGTKAVDSHGIPGMAGDRRALKRYHLMVQPFLLLRLKPQYLRARPEHSPGAALTRHRPQGRQLSGGAATFNGNPQPVADLGRPANGIHDLAGNAIPPNQVAAGRLCVQGAIIGCDRDDLGRLFRPFPPATST